MAAESKGVSEYWPIKYGPSSQSSIRELQFISAIWILRAVGTQWVAASARRGKQHERMGGNTSVVSFKWKLSYLPIPLWVRIASLYVILNADIIVLRAMLCLSAPVDFDFSRWNSLITPNEEP